MVFNHLSLKLQLKGTGSALSIGLLGREQSNCNVQIGQNIKRGL